MSGQYGQQAVVYFCTPEFVARCVAKEEIYLLLALTAPDFIYRHLPNWKSIRVRPTRWQVLATGSHSETSGGRTGYQLIQQHFKAHLALLDTPEPVEEKYLSPHQQAYLELLRDHIALTRQVQEDRARNRPTVVYNSVAATDAERLVRGTYTFQLSETNPFSLRDFVWVGLDGMNRQGRREQGRVTSVKGRQVTVKFERQIDAAQIRSPGVMGFDFNDMQQRIQEQALDALRDDKALNRNLLNNIVDNVYVSYPPPLKPEAGPLNPSQNRALNSGQAIQDTLLIWGPPGTGKTHTISTLVKNLADYNKKILITSQSNLAVDNVLKELADNSQKGSKKLRVIRIGHEDRVAPNTKHLLIDNQARDLQMGIVSTTNRPFQQLEKVVSGWKDVETKITELRALEPLWSKHLKQWEETQHALQAAQLVIWKQHEKRLKERMAKAHQAYQRAVNARRNAERVAGLLEWLLKRRGWPVLGLVIVALSSWLARYVAHTYQQAEKKRVVYMRFAHRYQAEVAGYYATAYKGPTILAAKKQVQEAETTLQKLEEAARNGLSFIQTFLAHSPIPLPKSTVATPEALASYLGRVIELKAILEWRYRLLAEWRECLEERRQALYPALIQPAHVVGATCIGIATDPHFRKLEFDTVIADEAGQIQAFDLLVPLVRARRAILVGDHQQLPPVVDDDVRALLDEEDEESIRLLEQSLFERLFEPTPKTHKVMLNTQYRMPVEIADFISQAFYKGEYYTDTSKRSYSADLFFSRPLCFIDTEHRKQYREYKGKGGETGCANPGEAEILARLATAYRNQDYNIGIIVPYKLQVAEVQRALRRRHSDLDDDALRELVATVDAFQGNQRDTILFGFTRSNNWGGIGFLWELRRLNVTITRAQRQLVLVGDSKTLTEATDQEFKKFACNLLDYIRQRGQYMKIEQLEEALRARGY
ncbi:MAG: AAA family ATPase [Anaerolineae bacterium]|nr:AAA family ATPase [Anaerolineae bacterium]